MRAWRHSAFSACATGFRAGTTLRSALACASSSTAIPTWRLGESRPIAPRLGELRCSFPIDRMQAILAHQFGSIDALRVEERPNPTAGRGEIVIDVAAAAINFPDVLVIEGRYQVKPPLPFIPGKELSGVVSAVGPDVSNYRIGDHVMALVEYGAFCE